MHVHLMLQQQVSHDFLISCWSIGVSAFTDSQLTRKQHDRYALK